MLDTKFMMLEVAGGTGLGEVEEENLRRLMAGEFQCCALGDGSSIATM